ncbi:hypothetical protein RJT34_04019 [Clitoria ternatea]|uniref:Uncharacterized protein n=1 Tax=Clitoria ternatea TaxID=43366 RepID=A0AAN9KK41_CLITE
MYEFDKVECELVTRDADLKAFVGPLKEESQLQRIVKIAVEIKLKEKKKECEIGKKAKESYEIQPKSSSGAAQLKTIPTKAENRRQTLAEFNTSSSSFNSFPAGDDHP